ncbi:MAG: 50S ribosomal protein L24e [Candidatus Micrarchaeia archaeon]
MRCSFCKKEMEGGTGIMYVRRDGSLLYFCSRKCRKNLIGLGRKPHNVRWVVKGAKHGS